MEACNGISDFIPNLCVSLTTASGPTLSSFAETVLIELANAFSKLPFRGTGCQSFLVTKLQHDDVLPAL
jgi:hypothetical protein